MTTHPFVSGELARERHEDLLRSAADRRLIKAAIRSRRLPAAVRVRPLDVDDTAQLAALASRLSLRSRRLRFLGPVAPPDALAPRLGGIRRKAVGAFVGPELVGAAQYVVLPSDASSAEVALEVIDSHQRHGIGARLLAELATLAGHAGIRRLTATTLRENDAVLKLARRQSVPVTMHVIGPELSIEARLDQGGRQPLGAC